MKSRFQNGGYVPGATEIFGLMEIWDGINVYYHSYREASDWGKECGKSIIVRGLKDFLSGYVVAAGAAYVAYHSW